MFEMLLKTFMIEKLKYALLLIIEAHVQVRRKVNPAGPDLDATILVIRFDLDLPTTLGSPA